MEVYQQLTAAILDYFGGRDCTELFLHGGCFWFAEQVHTRVPGSHLMFSRSQAHCGVYLDGARGLYDITGRISQKGFLDATEREIHYMRRHFIPSFDAAALSAHVSRALDGGSEKNSL